MCAFLARSLRSLYSVTKIPGINIWYFRLKMKSNNIGWDLTNVLKAKICVGDKQKLTIRHADILNIKTSISYSKRISWNYVPLVKAEVVWEENRVLPFTALLSLSTIIHIFCCSFPSFFFVLSIRDKRGGYMLCVYAKRNSKHIWDLKFVSQSYTSISIYVFLCI